MVECESVAEKDAEKVQAGFNRYMVECELNEVEKEEAEEQVLIDTWWNVNDVLRSMHLQVFHVLIDTWWNVNCIFIIKKDNNKKVLIDTWWNVNHGKRIAFCNSSYVLIDTWWNVNSCTVKTVLTLSSF